MFDKLKALFRVNKKVVKDEVHEITQLNITQEDEEQAQQLAVLVVAGLAACGIPVGVLGQKIIEKVLVYALRDLKDGVTEPDKLIIKRVVNEVKKEKIFYIKEQTGLYYGGNPQHALWQIEKKSWLFGKVNKVAKISITK